MVESLMSDHISCSILKIVMQISCEVMYIAIWKLCVEVSILKTCKLIRSLIEEYR